MLVLHFKSDYMSLFLIGCGIVFATVCGGLVALRFKDKLHLVLGFAAGAVLGVAFFELIPESIHIATEIGADLHVVSTCIALGFLFYLLVDRVLSLSHHHEEACENPHHKKSWLRAGSFSLHSLVDGLAIGFSFQADPTLGFVVAIGVLVHDFSDGLNVVSSVLRFGGSKLRAIVWLLADCIAPLLGIALSFVVPLGEHSLGYVLALFAGFFLYLGAADLLPESHHAHPTRMTTIMTFVGAGLMYVAILLAHGAGH